MSEQLKIQFDPRIVLVLLLIDLGRDSTSTVNGSREPIGRRQDVYGGGVRKDGWRNDEREHSEWVCLREIHGDANFLIVARQLIGRMPTSSRWRSKSAGS